MPHDGTYKTSENVSKIKKKNTFIKDVARLFWIPLEEKIVELYIQLCLCIKISIPSENYLPWPYLSDLPHFTLLFRLKYNRKQYAFSKKSFDNMHT